MESSEKTNCSATKGFIISGFMVNPENQFLLFLLFFFLYLVTVTSNITIVVLVCTNPQLHFPMYFFIGNLSLLETAYISSTLPNLMFGIITGNKRISFTACIVQLYSFSCLGATEVVLLTLMAYDRCMAICYPLRYALLMSPTICKRLAAVSWFTGIFVAMVAICLVAFSCFCGPDIIEHFLCESTPLLKLSCSDVSTAKFVLSISTTLFVFFSIFLTITSYSCIVYTVVKIPATSRRKKAFSTCASHFITVFFFYTSLCMMYVSPSASSVSRNTASAIVYGIITPLLNPFIYSLRNQDMKNAFRKMMERSRNNSFL